MKLFFKKKIQDFKILVIIYITLSLKYYLRSQLVVLNKIVNNNWLYFIFITLLIYGSFSCLGNHVCNSTHVVSWVIVSYLQATSIEIFIICRTPILRKWIIQVVGREYFVASFQKQGELVLRYLLPFFFFLFIEVLSTFLLRNLTSYLHEVCTNKYKDIYGSNGQLWPDAIKEQYWAEQSEILIGSGQGIVCYVAQKMTFFLNSIIEIIINFV